MADASTVAGASGVRAAMGAHMATANGVIKEKGPMGAIAHGAKAFWKWNPLIAGATAVTGAYIVGTKVMGRHEENVRNQAMAQQGQGRGV